MKEEIFTHRDDDGIFRHFPTSRMYEMGCDSKGMDSLIICANIPLESHAYFHIKSRMGIEQPRLGRLIEPYLSMPMIGIFWDDDKKIMTIVDGNHRYVKLYEMGVRQARCFVFKRALWEKLLIPQEIIRRNGSADPADWLEGDSGILRAEEKKLMRPRKMI